MPWLGSPTCDWVPKNGTEVCGQLATWQVVTHDFVHEDNRDPNAIRAWMMCADCALQVLQWAKKAQADGDGFHCRDCSTVIVPALGGFIISHGQLDDPEKDVRYDS